MLSTLLNSNKFDESDYDSHMAVLGSIIHSTSFGQLEIITNGLISFSKCTGIIDKVIDLDVHNLSNINGCDPNTNKHDILKHFKPENVLDYTGKLVLPGFVDAHCHAPQV